MSLFSKNLKVLRANSQLKQSKVAEIVGVTPSTWSNYEVGKSEPNLKAIEKISSVFGVSIDDLLCRDLGPIANNMLPVQPSEIDPHERPMRAWYRAPRVVTVDNTGQDNVLYIGLRDRVLYQSKYEDPEFLTNLPSYRLPFTDGLYRMFAVSGFTMLPLFTEGDILITRYCDNLLDVRDDHVYVLLTRENGLLFKRVNNHLAHKNKLMVRNDNAVAFPDHLDMLDNQEVLEIWSVEAHLNFSLYSPEAIRRDLKTYEERIQKLEQRISKIESL